MEYYSKEMTKGIPDKGAYTIQIIILKTLVTWSWEGQFQSEKRK